jgi:hypothetical protein
MVFRIGVMKKENVLNVYKHGFDYYEWKEDEVNQQEDRMAHPDWTHFNNSDSLEPVVEYPIENRYNKLPVWFVSLREEPANQVFGLNGYEERDKQLEGRAQPLSPNVIETWSFVRAKQGDKMYFIGAWLLKKFIDPIPDCQQQFLNSKHKHFYLIQDQILFDWEKGHWIDVTSPKNNMLPIGGNVITNHGRKTAVELIKTLLGYLASDVKM